MWHFYDFLALVFYRWHWYFLAEFAAYHAVLEAKETFGVNDNKTKKSVDDLLDIYKAQDKKNDADELIKDSITVWESSKGTEHPDVLELYEKLNKIQGNVNDFYFGIPLESVHELEPLKETVEDLSIQYETKFEEKVEERTDPKVIGRNLINLALFYGVQNKYDEAISLINYALSIWDGKETIDIKNIVDKKLLGAEDAVIKLIEEPMTPVPSSPSFQTAEVETFKWPQKSKKPLIA